MDGEDHIVSENANIPPPTEGITSVSEPLSSSKKKVVPVGAVGAVGVRSSGSVLDKAIAAIRTLKNASGSSFQGISKVCKTDFGYENEVFLKKAIKNGVASGALVQSKASYLVSGDPAYADIRDVVSIEDLVAGTSDRIVKNGDTIKIQYIGCLDDLKGYRFDSGSLSFTVGEKEVVKGMDSGVLGMRLGGRRCLTIPSSLGYGKKGCAPDIPPSSVLCFDVTLKGLG